MPLPSPPAAIASALPPAPGQPPEPDSTARDRILVGAAVEGGVGALPSADLGIEVTATLKRGRLRLEPLLGTCLLYTSRCV